MNVDLRNLDQMLESEVSEKLSLIEAASIAIEHSILKRAFEGKLVPQDPTDEPASALLSRLKVEPKQMETNGKERQRGVEVKTGVPKR